MSYNWYGVPCFKNKVPIHFRKEGLEQIGFLNIFRREVEKCR